MKQYILLAIIIFSVFSFVITKKARAQSCSGSRSYIEETAVCERIAGGEYECVTGQITVNTDCFPSSGSCIA